MSSPTLENIVEETIDEDSCQFCRTNKSKYCCPRCNALYCSLPCYKSNEHLTCSESFYRECIDQELKATQPNPSARNRMLEILTRAYRNNSNATDSPENIEKLLENDSDSDVAYVSDSEEEVRDSDDDDSIPDLSERMRDINLDNAERVWEALTINEKKEFEELIKSEDVTKILSLWEPWWLNHKNDKKIEEISKNVKEDSYVANCPAIQKNIQHFSKISTREPASCVRYNLYNVLASYVYIIRLFNGEHHFFDREAVSCLHCICKNLNGNVNFEDASTAVLSVVQECYNNPSIITDSETKKAIIDDLQCLLRGPNNKNKNHYILSALSDLHSILTETKVKYKKAQANTCKALEAVGDFAKKFAEHDMLELPQPEKKDVTSYLRKMEYLLSYASLYVSEATCGEFFIV